MKKHLLILVICILLILLLFKVDIDSPYWKAVMPTYFLGLTILEVIKNYKNKNKCLQ